MQGKKYCSEQLFKSFQLSQRVLEDILPKASNLLTPVVFFKLILIGYLENLGNDRRIINHTHYSTTDPDARVSVKPGKPRQLNYLAQVSVDTAHHVITQIQTDHADKKTPSVYPLY